MDIALEAVPWDIIGAAGMFAFLTYLVATGRLVPRATVDRLLADPAARIAYMETESTEQRATISSLVAQNAELSASGRLSVALLQSINGHTTAQSGSGDVAPTVQE
ncbi:hypothetical protein GV791_14950 [Nocardia cyriacigeorgica]|uniref:Uncharacterized protein n=1 Tax=Nocardia cyriacigeorgica TaxID=135487 RepID=A0A6P1CMQ4_9NOCA|nr:hypothetical protein [Nocardia cyriacigeorgica]NEW33851.1 hypothetical protein [Nocardia cyriacigeorgica]